MSAEALKASNRLSMKSSRRSYSRKDSEESLEVLNFLIDDETYRSSLESIELNKIELNENNCFPNDENDLFCDENHVIADDLGIFPGATAAVTMSTPKPFFKPLKKFEFSEALQLDFNYQNDLFVDNEYDKRLSVIVETSDIFSQSKSIHSDSNILSPQHVSLHDKLSIADISHRKNLISPAEYKLNKTVTFSTNSNECGLNKTVTFSTNSNECGLNKTVTLPTNDANSNGEGKLNKTMTFSNNCIESNSANKDFNSKVQEDMLNLTFDKNSLNCMRLTDPSYLVLPEKNSLDRILAKFNSNDTISKSIDGTESTFVLDAATTTNYANETFAAIPLKDKVANFLITTENKSQDTAFNVAEEFVKTTAIKELNTTQNINAANKTFSNESKSDVSEKAINEVGQTDNKITKIDLNLTVNNTLNDMKKFSTAPCKLLSQNISSVSLQNGIEAKNKSNLNSTFHVNLEVHHTKQACALGSSETPYNKFTSKNKPVDKVEHGLLMGNGKAKLYGRYSIAPRSDFQKLGLPGFKFEDRFKKKQMTNLEGLNTTFENLPKKLANDGNKIQKESKQISSNKIPTKNPKSMMDSSVVNNQNARASLKSNCNVLSLRSTASLLKYDTMPSKTVPDSKFHPKFDKKRQTDFKAISKITHNIKENIPLNSSPSSQRKNSNFGVSSLNISKNLGAKPKIAIKPDCSLRKSYKPVFKHANAIADSSKKKCELNQVTKPSRVVRKEPEQKKTELGRTSHSQKMLVEIPKDSQEPIIDQQRRVSLLPKPRKSFLPKPCYSGVTVKKDCMQI